MAATALSLIDALPVLNAGLRGGAAALLILASTIFLRAPASLPTRFGAALALCGIMASLTGLPPIAALDRFDPFVALCGDTCIPLFWIFTRAWFDDGFRPDRRVAALAIGYVGLGFVASLRRETPVAPINGLDLLLYLGGTAFALHALWLAWRSGSADLVEPRRRARAGFVLVLGGIILWLTGSEVVGRMTGAITTSTIAAAIALFVGALGLLILLVGLRHPDMFPVATDRAAMPPKEPAEPVDTALEQALDRLMADERMYRDPALTIGAMAARAGAPEYRLRRLINAGLGHRNVNEYLNGYRLREVCDALSDTAQTDVPITTIAMDAGFGSLSVFNRSFKARFGETPSVYRKRHIATPAVGASPD